MDVRPGYKQTEVGVVPEDWGQAAIRQIATKIGSGITPTGGSKRYKEYGRPFARSQNVGWGSLYLDDLAFIDEETHNSFPATELKKDDVLLNITGASIGRSALADERLIGGNVNQHVCIVRSDPNKALPKLINLLLLSDLGQRQIDSFQAGGNRQGLNFAQVGSIRFPLAPTKAEQEAIAEALSDADTLIEFLEQLIVKKRHLKQGAMQELLTGKKRLPEFEVKPGQKQSEMGIIPEDWDVKPLGALISSLEAGVSVNSVAKEKDVYAHNESILKTSCVIGGTFLPEEHKTIIPRDIHRARLNPCKDSIVISRMNTPALVGECGYVDRDYPNRFLPDRLWMTRHHSQTPHCVRWLAYLLGFSSFNRAIKESATGTGGSMRFCVARSGWPMPLIPGESSR
jgi:restriction endonuclease S subunit